jgi:uncharacterized protein (TIGR02588 family)
MNDKAKESRSSRSAKRKLAEWISLGVSVLLILGIATSLLVEALRGGWEYVPAEAVPQLERVVAQNGRYVLPIVVKNDGRHTMRDVRIEIEYEVSGEPHKQDFTIDYLGERSEQTIYIYLDHDPRRLRIEARPVQYRLE